VRYPYLNEITKNNHEEMFKLQKNCMKYGVEEGFHNVVLYTGQLHKVLNLKIFPQGDGPVNNIGGFQIHENTIIKMNLKDWNILKGKSPNQTIHNWNNDLSPIVHHFSKYE